MTTQTTTSIVLRKDREYMKNPMSVVENIGGANLKQSKIVLKVISRIQSNIRDYLNNIDARKEAHQLCLFGDDEFVTGIQGYSEPVKHFEIPLNEFDIAAKDYKLLEDAAKGLSSIIVPTMYEAPQGGMEVRFVPLMTAAIPLNKQGSKRKGVVNVYVPKNVAEQHWIMDKGYSEHLRNLADMCEKSYTVALLINMYNWFRQAMDYTISYSELRKKMGCTLLDDKGKVVKEKYLRFKDFSKRILDPSMEDAQKLFEQGKLDFCFTYTPDRGNRTCGEPVAITFHCSTKVKELTEQKDSPTLPEWTNELLDAYFQNRMEVVGKQVVETFKGSPRWWMNEKGEPCLEFETRVGYDLFAENMKDPQLATLYSLANGHHFRVSIDIYGEHPRK